MKKTLIFLVLFCVGATAQLQITAPDTALPGQEIAVTVAAFIDGIAILSAEIELVHARPDGTTTPLDLSSDGRGNYIANVYLVDEGPNEIVASANLGSLNARSSKIIDVSKPPLDAEISANTSHISIDSSGQISGVASVYPVVPGSFSMLNPTATCPIDCRSCSVSCDVGSGVVRLELSTGFSYIRFAAASTPAPKIVGQGQFVDTENSLLVADNFMQALAPRTLVEDDFLLMGPDGLQQVVVEDSGVHYSQPVIGFDINQNSWFAFTDDVGLVTEYLLDEYSVFGSVSIEGINLSHNSRQVFGDIAHESQIEYSDNAQYEIVVENEFLAIYDAITTLRFDDVNVFEIDSSLGISSKIDSVYDQVSYASGNLMVVDGLRAAIVSPEAGDALLTQSSMIDVNYFNNSVFRVFDASGNQIVSLSSDAIASGWRVNLEQGWYLAMVTGSSTLVQVFRVVGASQQLYTPQSKNYDVRPNTKVAISRTVTNLAPNPMTIQVSYSSSLRALLSLDSEPLVDNDLNGIQDTGLIAPGESVTIEAEILVPEDFLQGNFQWLLESGNSRSLVNDTLMVDPEFLFEEDDVAIEDVLYDDGQLILNLRNYDSSSRTVSVLVGSNSRVGPDESRFSLTLPPGASSYQFDLPALLSARVELLVEDSNLKNNLLNAYFEQPVNPYVQVRESSGLEHEFYHVKVKLPPGYSQAVIYDLEGQPMPADVEWLDESSRIAIIKAPLAPNTKTFIELLAGASNNLFSSIIVDNRDSAANSVGPWKSSQQVSGYYGQDFSILFNSGGTFRYNVAEEGFYELYGFWPGDELFDRVTLVIGDESLSFDQTKPANRIYLGRHFISPSQPVILSIPPGSVGAADAFELVRVDQYGVVETPGLSRQASVVGPVIAESPVTWQYSTLATDKTLELIVPDDVISLQVFSVDSDIATALPKSDYYLRGSPSVANRLGLNTEPSVPFSRSTGLNTLVVPNSGVDSVRVRYTTPGPTVRYENNFQSRLFVVEAQRDYDTIYVQQEISPILALQARLFEVSDEPVLVDSASFQDRNRDGLVDFVTWRQDGKVGRYQLGSDKSVSASGQKWWLGRNRSQIDLNDVPPLAYSRGDLPVDAQVFVRPKNDVGKSVGLSSVSLEPRSQEVGMKGARFKQGQHEVELKFLSGPLNRLKVHSVDPSTMSLGVENVPIDRVPAHVTEKVTGAFAINPVFNSTYEFSRVATGWTLLKCVDYDYDSRTCNGDFSVVRNTIPGLEYSVNQTPVDPLYIEVAEYIIAPREAICQTTASVDTAWSSLKCQGSYDDTPTCDEELVFCDDSSLKETFATPNNDNVGFEGGFGSLNIPASWCSDIQSVVVEYDAWESGGDAGLRFDLDIDADNDGFVEVIGQDDLANSEGSSVEVNVTGDLTGGETWDCNDFFGPNPTARIRFEMYRNIGGSRSYEGNLDYLVYKVAFNYTSERIGNSTANVTTPASPAAIDHDSQFTVQANISCLDGDCANMNATLISLPSNWWDGNYTFRRQLNITSGANSPYNGYDGYTVEYQLDTSTGAFREDGDDIRIIYNNSGSLLELDRQVLDPGSSSTKVRFALQQNISVSSVDDQYWLYHGNWGADSPPNDRSNIYLWYDDGLSDRQGDYTQGRVDSTAHGGNWNNGVSYNTDGYYDFDTDDNFADSLRPSTIDERDVYVEYEHYETDAYPNDMTTGPIVRYICDSSCGSGSSESSSHFYSYTLAYSVFENNEYNNHDDINEDNRDNPIITNGALGQYPDNQWNRVGLAVWGTSPTNLNAYFNNESGGWGGHRFSGTDGSSENTGSGQTGIWMQQEAGRLKFMLIRRYTEPEPSVAAQPQESLAQFAISGLHGDYPLWTTSTNPVTNETDSCLAEMGWEDSCLLSWSVLSRLNLTDTSGLLVFTNNNRTGGISETLTITSQDSRSPLYTNLSFDASTGSIVTRNQSLSAFADWWDYWLLDQVWLEHNNSGVATNYSFQDAGAIIGESGITTMKAGDTKIIQFSESFTNPIFVATPGSHEEGNDNALVVGVNSVTTSQASITLCQDQATELCESSDFTEAVHWIVIDAAQTVDLDWIDAGTISADTGESNTIVSFNKTFGNVPVVFTSPQTFTTGNLAAHSWADSVSTTQADIILCKHDDSANPDDCVGGDTETVGWFAIDPLLGNQSGFELSTLNADDGVWSTFSFSQDYGTPVVAVTAQDNAGGQDPRYPWARNFSNQGGQLRYCEQDGADDCDTHATVEMGWLATEYGLLRARQEIAVNLSDVLQFPTLGAIFFQSMYANDTSGNINFTQPEANFTLYSYAQLDIDARPGAVASYGLNVSVVCRVTDAFALTNLSGYSVNVTDNLTGFVGTFVTNSTGQIEVPINVTADKTVNCIIGDNSSQFLFAHDSLFNVSYDLTVDTVPPTWSNWALIYASNGSQVPNGAVINRSTSIYASALWEDDFRLDNAIVQHDGSGSFLNYTVSNFPTVADSNLSWSNFTLDFSNALQFASPGTVTVNTMFGQDLAPNTNQTFPAYNFDLYGLLGVSIDITNPNNVVNPTDVELRCRVADTVTTDGVVGYDVTFASNETGTIATVSSGADGWASYTYTDSSDGGENITCSIADVGGDFFFVEEDISSQSIFLGTDAQPGAFSTIIRVYDTLGDSDADNDELVFTDFSINSQLSDGILDIGVLDDFGSIYNFSTYAIEIEIIVGSNISFDADFEKETVLISNRQFSLSDSGSSQQFVVSTSSIIDDGAQSADIFVASSPLANYSLDAGVGEVGRILGDLDILAALGNSANPEAVFYSNDGTPEVGTWGAATNVGNDNDGEATAIIAIDFDDDQDADVAISQDGSSDVNGVQNTGGSWASTVEFDSNTNGVPLSLAWADLDNDGDADLIAGHDNAGSESLQIMENDGSPFAAWPTNVIGSDSLGNDRNYRSIATADVDLDGDVDFVACGGASNNVQLFENDGTPFTGTWASRNIYTSTACSVVAFADFDLDGYMDIVVGEDGTRQLTVLRNDEPIDGDAFDDTWGTAQSVYSSAGGSVVDLAVADISNDGYADVVAIFATDNTVEWFENDQTPFSDEWSAQTIDASPGTFSITSEGIREGGVEVGDINFDGFVDVVVAASAEQDIYWYAGSASPGGSWTQYTVTTGASSQVNQIYLSDVNEDANSNVLDFFSSSSENAEDGVEEFGGFSQLSTGNSYVFGVMFSPDDDFGVDELSNFTFRISGATHTTPGRSDERIWGAAINPIAVRFGLFVNRNSTYTVSSINVFDSTEIASVNPFFGDSTSRVVCQVDELVALQQAEDREVEFYLDGILNGSNTTNSNGNATWYVTQTSPANVNATCQVVINSSRYEFADNLNLSSIISFVDVAPTYVNWSASKSSGSNLTRNESFWISAFWSDNLALDSALLEHNGTGNFVNYSSSLAGFDDLANFSLNLSNATLFSSLGPISFNAMWANDTFGLENSTSPSFSYDLYSFYQLTATSVVPSQIYGGQTFVQTCSAEDELSTTVLEGVNVSFYMNATLAGTNVTNASGQSSWYYPGQSPGNVTVACQIFDDSNNYLFAGTIDQLNQTLLIRPINLSSVSPANGTVVDRDSQLSFADFATLVVETQPANSGLNITFNAMQNDPYDFSWVIGSNLTNSSGTAIFYFNPNSSLYAGNYTWFATANGGESISNASFVVQGSVSLEWFNLSFPQLVYNKPANLSFRLNTSTLGPETSTNFSSHYNSSANVSLVLPNSSTELLVTSRTLEYFNASYEVLASDDFGYYNATGLFNATYFSRVGALTRNITVLNTPPTHNEPVLLSDGIFNYSNENLILLNISTFDPDDQPVKNVVQWSFEDRNFSILNIPFEGGTNSTFSVDYAREENVSVNGAAYTSGSGFDGFGSLSFDGVNDFVNTSTNISAVLGQNSTLSIWLRTSSSGDASYLDSPAILGSRQTAGSSNDHLWGWIDDTGLLGVQVGLAGSVQTTSPVDNNSWIHAAITRDADSGLVRIFINGVLDANATLDPGVLNSTFSEFGVAWEIGGTNDYFNGSLDDIRVYDRVLSSQHISLLASGNASFIPSQETFSNTTWRACITPTDSFNDGTTKCSNTLFVEPFVNVTTFDESDLFSYRVFVDQSAVHFINFTKDFVVQSSGICNITFYDSTVAAIFNPSLQLWEVDRTYAEPGISIYNSTCNGISDINNISILSLPNVSASLQFQELIANSIVPINLSVRNDQSYDQRHTSIATTLPPGSGITSVPMFNESVTSSKQPGFITYVWHLPAINSLSQQSILANISRSGSVALDLPLAIRTNTSDSTILS